MEKTEELVFFDNFRTKVLNGAPESCDRRAQATIEKQALEITFEKINFWNRGSKQVIKADIKANFYFY